MSLDQAAWSEIARLWRAGEEPLDDIALRFGTSRQKIVATAMKAGWPRRKAAGPGKAAGASEAGATVQSPSAGVTPSRSADEPERPVRRRKAVRKAMVERLFDAMDTKLSLLETHIAAGADVSAADSERTTRALNTLVRSLEKLAAYEAKLKSKAGKPHAKRRPAGEDAERRRAELARRIQRLLDSR